MDDESTGSDEPPGGNDAEKYCLHCGASLNKYSRFCTECGTNQEQAGGGPDGSGSGSGSGPGPGRGGGRTSDRRSREGSGAGGRRDTAPGETASDRLRSAGPDSDTGVAALAHVLALFTGLFGPIVLYAVTDDPFVRENAANAINWQLLFLLLSLVAFFGGLTLVSTLSAVLLVFALCAVLALANLVLVVVATVRALDGEAWAYPLTPDLL